MLFNERKPANSSTLPRRWLRRAWRNTGLRATDFDDALHRLDAQGCTSRMSTTLGVTIDLLPAGQQRLHALSAEFGEIGSWVSEALSTRFTDERYPQPNSCRRRLTDHEAESST
jgi:hypothetical protein